MSKLEDLRHLLDHYDRLQSLLSSLAGLTKTQIDDRAVEILTAVKAAAVALLANLTKGKIDPKVIDAALTKFASAIAGNDKAADARAASKFKKGPPS